MNRLSQLFGRMTSVVGAATATTAALCFALALWGSSISRADTIYLKNGNFIPDCKILSEDKVFVSVRTPSGDMTIPRTEIVRIQRVKTVVDQYKEQLAKIHEKDYNSLYKLALWCRKTYGLRKESGELLEKVIELRPDHAPARKLLGHLRVGREWVVPEPLQIELKVSGVSSEDLHSKLQILLNQRKDVGLAPLESTRKKSKDESAQEVGPLDQCTLRTSVIIARQAPSKFFGQSVTQTMLTATVRMEAASPWIGRKTLKTAAAGQIPARTGSSALAIQNAFGTSSLVLHKFFDELVAERLRHVERDLVKKARSSR